MMPPVGSPPTKRRHVTTACVPCRQSKVKCDAITPTCSHCQAKGKLCRYQLGEDKRKLSLRGTIDLLAGQLDRLYEFIYANGLTPPTDDETDTTLAKLGYAPKHKRNNPPTKEDHRIRDIDSSPTTQLEVAQVTSNNYDGPVQPETASDASFILPGVVHSVDDVDLGVSSHAPRDPQPYDAGWQGETPSFSLGAPDFFDFNPAVGLLPNADPDFLNAGGLFTEACPDLSDTSSSDAESTEALVDQLSDRIGTLQIGPGGQTRYYGPTSNFNLVEMPAPDNLTVHRTVRRDGHECLTKLDLSKEVPVDLEKHLTDLYFAWQDPSLHAVDRGMYEQSRVTWTEMQEDTPYYSESLRNAICALGAAFESRHHRSFVTFPRSLSDFFADRAKALLEIELDCPTVATVQALVVLSGHDIGCKRDARGWLSSGMAMRLAFHLALHIDMAPYVERGSMRPQEAELRRTVFWSAYAVDHLWGFFLGRPFRTNMDDVTVSKPHRAAARDGSDFWIAYTSPESVNDSTPLPDPKYEVIQRRISMCEIMAPLGYALYGCRVISPHQLQEMNAKIVAELLEWKDNLPPELQVDLDDYENPYLPHVLMLHMQYHQNIIHAHRPWMSKTLTQPQPKQGPGYGHARMMCIDAAVAIGKLLQLYESRYTLRQMNVHGVGITCSAASILIFVSVTSYPGLSSGEVASHLSACFRALDCFSASWETAKKARDFLIMLQRKWELKGHDRGIQKTTPRKRVRTVSQSSPSRNAPESRASHGYVEGQGSGRWNSRHSGSWNDGLDLFLTGSSFSS